MAVHEKRVNSELERAVARAERAEAGLEDAVAERNSHASEIYELMTIQAELNDELRQLRGDKGTGGAVKGLFGNTSFTQTRLDDTEEEVSCGKFVWLTLTLCR